MEKNKGVIQNSSFFRDDEKQGKRRGGVTLTKSLMQTGYRPGRGEKPKQPTIEALPQKRPTYNMTTTAAAGTACQRRLAAKRARLCVLFFDFVQTDGFTTDLPSCIIFTYGNVSNLLHSTKFTGRNRVIL